MGCGLSRPWKRQRPREAVQQIRPLAETSPSDGEEEEKPLLLAVGEELCDQTADGPEIHAGSAICPAGSGAFAVKVCGLLGLALALAALVVLREALGKEFHVLHAKVVGSLRRFAPGPCFTNQIRKIMEWAILTCRVHCAQLLLYGMLPLALFLLKTCSERLAEFVVGRFAGEERVNVFFAKAEVAQMVLLWLADMLSDVYVTYKYCKQKMYAFALLMILIWLGSGCVAFGHRYVSWERCGIGTNFEYWASGLNERAEPKPGFKSFALYVAQIQPVVMAWDSWLHGMTRHLRTEKMLAALAEGAPSSLLQIYAVMLEPPQENLPDLLILCGSIGMSILTVAVGINTACELCVPESRKLEKTKLSPGALLCFRWCDSFSRIGAWALLGMCLRPIGAKLHGVQQPYLPLILAAELLLITAIFKSQKFGLSLQWSEFFKEEYLVSVMASFLGIYWCCNPADLAAQHRLSRSLLALRFLQTLGTLWLCVWSFSISVGSECLAAEEPAVVIVALLVLLTFALAFLTALAHHVAMSFFALPFFPVIAGRRGGRLELAARIGVASQIPRLLRATEGDNDGVAALCQAAGAGQSSVIHSLVDAGVSPIAKWEGSTALHRAAAGGHVHAIHALQSCGENDLERATDNGGTAGILAASSSHLEVLQFLHWAGCDFDKADNHGCTAGILAAANGHLEVVQFLHGAGCDWDKATSHGNTARLFAAAQGHLEVVQFLHRAGCDFDKASNGGNTAGICAAANGHLEVVQFLHRAGCDFDKANSNGRNAGIGAAHNGHLEVVQFLHSIGCDFDKANNDGDTAGILAAQNCHLKVVQFLQQAGCNFDKANNFGGTAGLLAAHRGHLEVVKYLRSAGCDFGARSLHAATGGGHLSVVDFLLSFVDVNAVGIGKVRALDIARAKDPNGPVTEVLLRAGAAPGPKPQLVGLTALKPLAAPPHGYVWFTCGATNLAQSRGKFYHEIQILSEFGFPQLGWLSTDFEGGADDDDKGVGDDANGWAFDAQGCCCWHVGRREPLQIAPWKVNDVLGFAIDLDQGQMQLRTEQQELTMPFRTHGAVCLACDVCVCLFPNNLAGTALQDPTTSKKTTLRFLCFLVSRKPQGTLQQASRASFECIWPNTVGSSTHLEGTASGVAGTPKETNRQNFAKNEGRIGPNPLAKSWRWVNTVVFLTVDRT